jgi:hypothetical protein
MSTLDDEPKPVDIISNNNENKDKNNNNIPGLISKPSSPYFMNFINTSPQIPSSAAFDFDSIGQLLMSPNPNALSLNTINNNSMDLMGSPKLNLPVFKPNQLETNNNILFKDYPSQSMKPEFNLNGAISPFSGFMQLNTDSNISADPKTISAFDNINQSNLGLGLIDFNKTKNNNELLSNTESLALESFLDSIANEGLVNKTKGQSRSQLKSASKEKKRKPLATDDDTNPATKKIIKNNNKSITSPKIKRIKKDDSTKKLSKQERQVVHNLTEQKRRDTIKEAFDKLNSLVQSSKFDLQDKDSLLKQTKKRKRKSTSAKSRPMKKFEVLQRAVREIEILVQKNNKLYTLLNESELENPIVDLSFKDNEN